MTDVLGYPKYATHGTDWGSFISWSLYDNFNGSVRVSHFDFLPFLPKSPSELAALNITLSSLETFEAQGATVFGTIGTGYVAEQSTEVCI